MLSTYTGHSVQEVLVNISCLQEERKAGLFNSHILVNTILFLASVMLLYQLEVGCLTAVQVYPLLVFLVAQVLVLRTSFPDVFLDANNVESINEQV